MIVYSSPREVSIADAESGNVEWYWEGMQGDYTDPVLTDYVTGQFNQSFQSALEAGDKSVSDSLASAFDTATVNAGTLSRQVHFSDMFMGFFMLGFIAFHAFFFLGLNELKYRKQANVSRGIQNWVFESATAVNRERNQE